MSSLSSCAGLRLQARRLKQQTLTAYFAARDPRTPWWLRALAALVAAYALSPIDLIPDFIPVLGYLDELVLIPLGLALIIRLAPPEVLTAARARAAQTSAKPISYAAAAMIVACWMAALAGLGLWLSGRL
jgi:uncharacterized membrane protein YkvA (DUF1232 family)